jgi:hypothetical protein
MNARIVSFFLLLAFTPVVPAMPPQQDRKAPELDTSRFGDPTSIARGLQGDIYGVIKQINDKEIVLDKTKFGVDTTIKLEPRTKYVRDRKSGSFDQLKIGDPVYVRVKTDKKSGTKTAKQITSGVIAGP